jgi:hypothetical protein
MGKVAPALADIDPVPSGSCLLRLIFSRIQRYNEKERPKQLCPIECSLGYCAAVRLVPCPMPLRTGGTTRRDER